MAVEDRPSLIIVRTHIGYGSPHKQDTAGAHGSPLGEEEIRLTKEAIGWDPDKPFYVPEEALAHFRAALRARRASWRPSGTSRLRRLHARRIPEQAELLRRLLACGRAAARAGTPRSRASTPAKVDAPPARRPRRRSSGRPRRSRS